MGGKVLQVGQLDYSLLDAISSNHLLATSYVNRLTGLGCVRVMHEDFINRVNRRERKDRVGHLANAPKHQGLRRHSCKRLRWPKARARGEMPLTIVVVL